MNVDALLMSLLFGILFIWVMKNSFKERGAFSPNNYFSRVPDGSWTHVGQMGPIDQVLPVIGLAGLCWLVFNIPAYALLGIAYIMLYLFYLIQWSFEVFRPIFPWNIAVLDPGSSGNWSDMVAVGGLAGLLFFFVASSLGVKTVPGAGGATLVDSGLMALGTVLIAIGVAAPFVEEQVFRGFVTPTMTQNMGIVGGLLINGVLFSGWHWGAFKVLGEGLTTPMFIISFFFGIVAGILALHFQSTMPAIIMHISYNMLILLFPPIPSASTASIAVSICVIGLLWNKGNSATRGLVPEIPTFKQLKSRSFTRRFLR